MFWYLPLPRYAERYTEYLSGSKGVFEQQLLDWEIPFRAIRPSNELHYIATGVVLDPEVMCRWGFAQTFTMVKNIMDGAVSEGDTIHFEDFWHPGMEMIPYALSLKGLYKKVTLSAYNFAQSVDPNDFTAKMMMPWIRGFEMAWESCLDFIFCASPDHVELMKEGWGYGYLPGQCKYIAVGTMFSSDYLKQAYNPRVPGTDKREKVVVYSSRLDEEKDPHYLIAVIKAVHLLDPEIEFVICSSAKELRGDDFAVQWLTNADDLKGDVPTNVTVLTGMTKTQYYEALSRSAVQFNCAKQDFVSYTLLEATTFGCVPFYPIQVASFPPALGQSEELLYDKELGPEYCAQRLVKLVNKHAKTPVNNNGALVWVYQKYDHSIERMLLQLGFAPVGGIRFDSKNLEDYLQISEKMGQMYDMYHGVAYEQDKANKL